MDLNLAYEHLKYAINNKPDDPSYNDSMGWFYYKTGHFNLSRKYLSKALQIKPDMAEPLLHLAKLELHESNIDKALEKSIDALKINPETEGLVSFIGFVTAAKTINMELKKIEELKTQSVQSLNKKFSLSSSLARLYYTNGFLLKSKEIYLKLLDIIPDKTLFLKKIEEIDALIAGKISFTGNAELITHKKPLPDYLNKIPDQSIQFSIFNNSLINRIFEFSYNNFELLKIFNKNIFFELKPELILQYIIPDSSNNKIELVFIAEYKNSKNINSNLKNLINVFNFISKNQRIHTLENPEDMPLWTVIFFNRTFYISFVNNKLFITSSKKLLNEFTMNTLNFKSIKNSSEFVTLWNKNKAPEFHAIFYSNKIFFEKLFEKIPALNSVNNFSNLKNIKNCLEKIYFKNANTLDEYYSIETSDSETSNKIGDFLNNMINMSKSLYESKIIKINPLIETEDKFVTAHIEVNGFLGMKDFLSKHIFKNKPFIKKIIKLIKFKK
jgi:tetratricopeptide (TPR) repeat protein